MLIHARKGKYLKKFDEINFNRKLLILAIKYYLYSEF